MKPPLINKGCNNSGISYPHSIIIISFLSFPEGEMVLLKYTLCDILQR